MAQDFHAAFQVGDDDKHITTVDADGVALAAIQGCTSFYRRRTRRLPS
jgi:trimeric autotransporter adhesin